MDIYAIGDGALLVVVLNAIAMLFGTGGEAFMGSFLGLGLSIAILMVGIRAILTQKLELQYVLLTMVVYMTMFGPKTTVTVTDVRTGAVQVVANVPIGVAAIGSITSTVGYELTEAMETVFAVPGMTEYGYLDPLNLILSLRDMDAGPANSTVPPSTVNYEKTLNAYLVDCVMQDIERGGPGQQVTVQKLKASRDLLTDIAVNATGWWTTTYLTAGNPDGTTATCSDAYNAIVSYTNGTFAPAWLLYVRDKLKLPDTDDVLVRVDHALTSVYATTVNAQQYMLSAYLKRLMENAELDFMAANGYSAGVLMLQQAVSQRQIQWAAEKSMFLEVAQPLMAAFESMFYAMSPMIAFLIMLGPFGWKVLIGYLTLAAWIQLWTPIMAFNNMYLWHVAQTSADRMSQSGTDIFSVGQMDSTWTSIGSWYATGGMLAGMTPMIALFLVSGSIYAFTSMASRTQGQDHINERIAAPDIVSPAAAVQAGSMRSYSARESWTPGEGVVKPGAAAHAISFSTSMQRQVQSLDATSKADVSSFLNTLSNTMTTGDGGRVGSAISQMASNLRGSETASNWQGALSKAEQFRQNYGVDFATREQIAAMAAMGAGVPEKIAKKIGISGGADGQNRAEWSEGQSAQLQTAFEAAARDGFSWTDVVKEGASNDLKFSTNSAFDRTFNENDSTLLAKSFNTARESRQAFQEASLFSNASQAAINTNAAELSRWAIEKGDLGALDKIYSDSNLGESKAIGMAGSLDRIIGGERSWVTKDGQSQWVDQRMIGGKLGAIMQFGSAEDREALYRWRFGEEMHLGDARKYEGLEGGRGADVGSVERRATGAELGHGGVAIYGAGISGGVVQGMAGIDAKVNRAPEPSAAARNAIEQERGAQVGAFVEGVMQRTNDLNNTIVGSTVFRDWDSQVANGGLGVAASLKSMFDSNDPGLYGVVSDAKAAKLAEIQAAAPNAPAWFHELVSLQAGKAVFDVASGLQVTGGRALDGMGEVLNNATGATWFKTNYADDAYRASAQLTGNGAMWADLKRISAIEDAHQGELGGQVGKLARVLGVSEQQYANSNFANGLFTNHLGKRLE